MQGRPEQRVPLTELLRRWAAGDQEAVESLTPLIYGELRRIAGARLREERSGHTLQPTELVHEALRGSRSIVAQGRGGIDTQGG
jgi:hypothetical protein